MSQRLRPPIFIDPTRASPLDDGMTPGYESRPHVRDQSNTYLSDEELDEEGNDEMPHASSRAPSALLPPIPVVPHLHQHQSPIYAHSERPGPTPHYSMGYAPHTLPGNASHSNQFKDTAHVNSVVIPERRQRRHRAASNSYQEDNDTLITTPVIARSYIERNKRTGSPSNEAFFTPVAERISYVQENGSPTTRYTPHGFSGALDGSNDDPENDNRRAMVNENVRPIRAKDHRHNIIEDLGVGSLTARAAMMHPPEQPDIQSTADRHLSSGVSSLVDMAPTRHYDGCMLCDPLPAPRESMSSGSDIYEHYHQDQDAGPPPDFPLPVLQRSKSSGLNAQSPSSPEPLSPEFFEGEIAHPIGPPPVLPMEPPTRALIGSKSPKNMSNGARAPIYTSPQLAHGKSLSTLQERDEESSAGQSRAASRFPLERGSQDRIPKVAGLAIYQEGENRSRPQTSRSDDSDLKLIDRRPSFGVIPVTPAERSSHFASIQETVRELMSTRSRQEQSSAIPPVMGSPLNQFRGLRSSSMSSQAQSITNGNNNRNLGSRRGRRAVDDAYEMGELDHRTGTAVPHIEVQSRPKQSSWPARKFGTIKSNVAHFWSRMERIFGRGRMRSIQIGIALLLIILFVALMVIFVGFPRMAQSAVNKANVSIASITMDNFQPRSVGLKLEVRLDRGGSQTSIEPGSQFRVSKKGSKRPDPYSSNPGIWGRDHIPNHVLVGANKTQEENGLLGFVAVKRKSQLGDDRGLELLGDSGEDQFIINDTESWSDVIETILFINDGYEVDVEGDIHVRWGLLEASPEVKKTVMLPSMNGITSTVFDFNMAPPENSMDFVVGFASSTFSPVSLYIHNVTFDLVLNDTVIGKALAPRFSVAGFSLTFRPEAAAGRFNPDIFKENPQLYSDFLMALQQPTGNSMLALRGANVTADGKEVSWMIPSIQKVEIPFQIPSLEAETPQNTTRDIDMTFTIVENGTSRAIRSGYIGTEVVLPAFASAAVQTLNNSAYSLQFMSVDNQDLAIVNIPPAQAPVVVDENFINRTISEAEIAVTDEVLYANRFLRPIIHNNTVTFLVSGNASAEVDTAVGRATLPARVPQQELMVRGLNGLRNGASLRDIRVLGADNQSVVLSTIMSFSSASQVGISLGDVRFQLVSQADTDESFGVVRFPSFDITYGKNDLNATIRLPTASNNQEYDAFFSGVFGKADIEFRLKADQTSSSSNAISSALDGLNFTTKASGAALKFVDSFTVSGSSQAPSADIMFINPLGINIAVTSLELEIRRSANRQVLGTVATMDVQGESIPPMERKEFSAPFSLGPGISEEGVSGAEELLIAGEIGLALGATNIMVNFEEEIPRVG